MAVNNSLKNELILLKNASVSYYDLLGDIVKSGYRTEDIFGELSGTFEEKFNKCLDYCLRFEVANKDGFIEFFVDILRRGFLLNQGDYCDWEFILGMPFDNRYDNYAKRICGSINNLLDDYFLEVDVRPIIDLLLELINSIYLCEDIYDVKRLIAVKTLCVDLVKSLATHKRGFMKELGMVEKFVINLKLPSIDFELKTGKITGNDINAFCLPNYYWVKEISNKNISKHVNTIALNGSSFIACQFLSDIDGVSKEDTEILSKVIMDKCYPSEARIMFEHISRTKMNRFTLKERKKKK